MATRKTTIKTGKHVVKKRVVNHIAICVDKSGSMQGLWDATRKALNGTIDDIAENAEKLGQPSFVSLYQFGTSVNRVFKNKPIKAVLHDEETRFVNLGMTALRDATGDAIEDLCGVDTNDGDDHAFLVIVITDGEENNQIPRFTKQTLARLIKKVQSTDLWTITFMVPPGARYSTASDMGVPEGNVTEWEQTERGSEEAGVVRRMSVGSYYTARSQGQTKSTNFYATTDASSITKKDLSQMDNIARNVKVWSVDREVAIRPFVESKGVDFRRGCGFYQLSKKEKIQSYKRILIMEKGSKAVYEGDDARALLGLPIGRNAIVTPGNHANFDIFPQSTSDNRKLVRGTKFIHYPAAATS